MQQRRRWAVVGPMILTGLLFAADGWAVPMQAPSEQPSPTAVEEATKHFLAGQDLYEKTQFDAALKEFQASYDTVNSPNSRLYVARCLRKLGRKGDAYHEYTHVVAEAEARAAKDPKYAGTLSAAKDELTELKAEVALVTLLIPADVKSPSVRVGGKPVDAARLSESMAVDPGQVSVEVSAPGRLPYNKVLEFKVGDDRKLAVELPVDENAGGSKGGGPLRTYAYISGGVGVAGLALWGIFGVMAKSRYDDLSAACMGRCDASRQDEVDAGRTQTAVSNAGLVVGIVGIAGGVGLFVYDWKFSKPADTKPADQAESLKNPLSIRRVGVQGGPGSGMLTVGGVF